MKNRYRVLTEFGRFIGYVWLPEEINDDVLVNAFRIDCNDRKRPLIPGRLTDVHMEGDRLQITWENVEGVEWMINLIKAEEDGESNDEKVRRLRRRYDRQRRTAGRAKQGHA